ncbi:MAG: riboflavin synthase subunit alpha [Marine Group III euryarchaeote CG-Epi4]|uniref:Riboflavin synthase n=1 Tax=Marine Group III euryarchaeote CG-Epi4 TaxID=1888998 RepID=A0A1J5TJK7_9ARCH|nr:MAG: riboflavin synthase subunit alpha [Marine Group III euryarchaeote CG-Epi4]|tara:strand:+ start:3641 stop:4255 length:615 start_codon:yes stop_codon:yes gene_type:complete
MVFTGIVQEKAKVTSIEKSQDFSSIRIEASLDFVEGIKIGASVSIDGVCLTVTSIEDNSLTFDVIVETLRVTTLSNLEKSDLVNLERAARFGDEIGGHIISGHVSGIVKISRIESTTNNHILSFKTSSDLIKYIFPKGYVSLNGISLTIGEVNRVDNTFTVYLIPETLRITTMQDKNIGDMINLEIETQTKNTVDLITEMQVKK